LKTEELSGSMSTASSDARAASVQYLSALLDIQRLKLQEFQEDKKAKTAFRGYRRYRDLCQKHYANVYDH
jgi:hypothetical protein